MKLTEERTGKTLKTVITDNRRSCASGIDDAYGSDTKYIQVDYLNS